MHHISDNVSISLRNDPVDIELILEMRPCLNVSELVSEPLAWLLSGWRGLIDDTEDLLVELVVRLTLPLELLQSQLLVALFQVPSDLRDLRCVQEPRGVRE